MSTRTGWSVPIAALLFWLLYIPAPVRAADPSAEHRQLALMLRQIDAIERIIQEQEQFSVATHSRYHFDYAQLRGDIDRIRHGIRSFLTPERAQPNDTTDIIGYYHRVGKQP